MSDKKSRVHISSGRVMYISIAPVQASQPCIISHVTSLPFWGNSYLKKNKCQKEKFTTRLPPNAKPGQCRGTFLPPAPAATGFGTSVIILFRLNGFGARTAAWTIAVILQLDALEVGIEAKKNLSWRKQGIWNFDWNRTLHFLFGVLTVNFILEHLHRSTLKIEAAECQLCPLM